MFKSHSSLSCRSIHQKYFSDCMSYGDGCRILYMNYGVLLYSGFTEFIDLLLRMIQINTSFFLSKAKLKQYEIKQGSLSATKIPFGDKLHLCDFMELFFCLPYLHINIIITFTLFYDRKSVQLSGFQTETDHKTQIYCVSEDQQQRQQCRVGLRRAEWTKLKNPIRF